MTGYQEVITDPSYAGQIITFTNPHIGNYGVNADRRRVARHVLPGRRRPRTGPPAQQPPRRRRPRRACCAASGVPGIAGIDTRRLTRLIRDTGAMPGAFGTGRAKPSCSAPPRPSRAPTASTSSRTVTTPSRYTIVGRRRQPRRIVAYDYGIKRTILRHLAAPRHRRGGARRRRRPPTSWRASPTASSCRNGPGDPADGAATPGRGDRRPARAACRSSASASATSCSARALGAETVKLPFGHHGGNHPVQQPGHRPDRDHQPEPQLRRRRRTRSADRPTMTHVNLNDGVCEGLQVTGEPRLQRAAPPRGRPRPARRQLPVRRSSPT